MSFLTDTDVNKRKDNVFVAFESASPPVGFPSFRLKTALGDMDFAAVYAADHPGVVGIGGAWNPGFTGGEPTFAEGDALVTFENNTVGSSVGTNSYNPIAVPGCWEIEIVAVGSGGCVGEYLGNLFLYDANAYAGGRFNTGVNISFYESDGKIYGNEVPATPLTAGDVVGMVVYDPQQIDYYLNGVLVDTEQWGGSTVIPMCACGQSA